MGECTVVEGRAGERSRRRRGSSKALQCARGGRPPDTLATRQHPWAVRAESRPTLRRQRGISLYRRPLCSKVALRQSDWLS